jgi:hypothetical protein
MRNGEIMAMTYKSKVSDSHWMIWHSNVNGDELLHTFTTEEEADYYLKTGKKLINKYNVVIARTSTLIYEYEVEAGCAEEAEMLAKDDHFDADLDQGKEVWAEEVIHEVECLEEEHENDE